MFELGMANLGAFAVCAALILNWLPSLRDFSSLFLPAVLLFLLFCFTNCLFFGFMCFSLLFLLFFIFCSHVCPELAILFICQPGVCSLLLLLVCPWFIDIVIF